MEETTENLTVDLEDEGVVVNKDYDALFHKPQINSVTLEDNKTLTELGIQPAGDYVVPSDLDAYYTKSQMDITLSTKANTTDIPTDNSQLANGAGYATKTYVDAEIEATIDIPPQTIMELKELAENLDDIAMKNEIPTKTSELTNDSNYATTSQIPTKISDLQNDSDFTTVNFVSHYVAANNPKVKNITLLTSGWVQNQTTELYEYTITDSDVTANHFIDLTGTIENQILDGCEVQSYAGYYIIRTTKLPESNINATVKIELTNPVVNTGGE